MHRNLTAEMDALLQSDLHMWVALYHQWTGPDCAERSRVILTRDELDTEKRFRFEEDRLRYRTTRFVVRTVLSRYAPIRAADWRFKTNIFGRPEILNPEGEDLRFNISHSRGVIVLALTRARDVGVDVERVNGFDISWDLVTRYFASDEIAQLAGSSGASFQRKFYEFWTLKESYIKARGLGFSLPLDRFGFDLRMDGCIKLSVSTGISRSTRLRLSMCLPLSRGE
jgi:4'-phosphopantetheinyl transferase